MATDKHLQIDSAATMWAHLTRKDTVRRTTASMDTGSFIPGSGALDKTATTTRVLLHDTQMNLERFSTNVERLIHGVQETEQGIKMTASLFEEAHDKLMGDIIDLVNRAQTKIQASIGTPAQSSVVDGLFRNIDRRFESLDQRLDAIQVFNQTHSQALQTQMQTIQALQTQQNAIISAVAPLLPLLQTLTSYPHPSRVSAVFASPRTSHRQPDTTATIIGPGLSMNKTHHPRQPSKKRARSKSDAQNSSSPSVGMVARKKIRIESPPLGETNVNLPPEPSVSKGNISTPRRPLQELFHSPLLSITPLAQQSTSWQPSSTKQGVPNRQMENIIRQMSMQRNPGPQNDSGRGRSNTLVPQINRVTSVIQEKALPTLDPSMALPYNRANSSLGTAQRSSMVPPRLHQAMQPTRSEEHSQQLKGKRFIPMEDTDSTDEGDD